MMRATLKVLDLCMCLPSAPCLYVVVECVLIVVCEVYRFIECLLICVSSSSSSDVRFHILCRLVECGCGLPILNGVSYHCGFLSSFGWNYSSLFC